MDLVASLIPGFQPPIRDHFATLTEGRVLRAPANETQGLSFVLAPFDAEAHEWGPCPWMPRVVAYTHPHTDGLTCRILLPVSGDRVLVGFTTDGNSPWVVAWWPASNQNTRV